MTETGDSSGTDWLAPLLVPLARLLNQLLSLDPEAGPLLDRLNGRRLAVILTTTPMRVAIDFEGHGVRLSAGATCTDGADACIEGSPLALLALARDPLGGGDTVRFSGDLGFVRDVRQLLARLDIDPEELLSRWVGDEAAHQAGRAGREFRHWLDGSRRAAVSGLAEYLTEESRLLPSRPEVDAFLGEVDVLREGADRLEARLRGLERRHTARRRRT